MLEARVEQAFFVMWYLWLLLMDDRVWLSRLIAIPAGLLAEACLVMGILSRDSIWFGVMLASSFGGIAVGVWRLGDWWKKRGEKHERQEEIVESGRGFEVVEGRGQRK